MAVATTTELTGQVALVTGASSGIGRAIAIELATSGADILVHAAHNRAEAEQTAAEIVRLDRQAKVLLANFESEQAISSFSEQAWNWRGNVDICVNNAGVDILTGQNREAGFEQKLARLWQVDVLGSVRLSKSIGARMKLRGRGTIINIGWDQAESGMAGDTAELFATTKGAVMAFTRSVAKSLAPQVRVNCIAPGWVKTAWGEHASDAWQRRAEQESILGRWGMPEDIAKAVRFLASPATEFITGEVIAVNGGRR